MSKNKVLAGSVKTPLTTRWCFLFYLSLAGILTVSHHHWIDKPFESDRRQMHEKVIQRQAPAPIQYRILMPHFSESLQKCGMSFKASFVAIRFLFTALSGILLHLFMRRWFSLEYCFLGTVFFYACLPLTHLNYYLQPMDLPNLVLMILAFFWVRDRKDLRLAPLIVLAMLNRETFVLVPLVWLFYRWDELSLGRVILRFGGYCALALGVYFGLRAYYGHQPYYSEAYFLSFNAKSWQSYLYFGLMFGVLGFWAFRDWGQKPKFLRRTLLFVPFFVLFHFILTIFQEPRLMLPLFPILIPLALASWTSATQEPPSPVQAPSWLLKSAKVFYILGFLVFVGGIQAFAHYLEVRHVAPWRSKVRDAELALKMGYEEFRNQQYQQAAQAWEKGLDSNPQSFDLHYNLAALYSSHISQPTLALAHWRMCLEINPQHPKASVIQQEIERLEKTSQ